MKYRLRLSMLFVAAGGLALSVQITLQRELMVAMQGDESSVGIGLFAWLAGIAAGAALTRRFGLARPGRWVGIGCVCLALAGPVGIVATRMSCLILAPPPGELFAMGNSILLGVLVLFPPGAFVGLMFTTLAATASEAGWAGWRAISSLYVFEALGSLAAGLAVTFLLIPSLSPFTGACLGAACWLLLSMPASWTGLVSGRSVMPAMIVLLAMAATPIVSSPVESITVEMRFKGVAPGIPLLASAHTPYMHFAVGGGEVRHVYESGRYTASFPDRAGSESAAHTIATLSPDPDRIVIFGNAGAGMVRALLEHPVAAIDLVSIDSRATELFLEYLPEEDRRAIEDPRIRIVHDDPRRFLAEAGPGYGLIVLLEPDPVTLLSARLSTVQFYRLCSGRLDEDGVLVVGIGTGPNILTGERALLAGTRYRSLMEVFPVVRAGPGPEALLVAGRSREAATLDSAALAARYTARGIRSEVFVPELFEILFPDERVRAQEDALTGAAAIVPASTDDRPASFLHALRVRRRIEGNLLADILGSISRIPPSYLAGLALIPSVMVASILAISRRRTGTASLATGHAVAATGACGISWSLLILYSYQTSHGALYGRIGWLTALFMFGLMLGSAGMSLLPDPAGGRTVRRLATVTAAAALFGFVLAGVFHHLGGERQAGEVSSASPHLLLMLLSGVLTGATFPVAARRLLASSSEVGKVAGRMEAADHGGAALAALVVGVIMVPSLGMTGTALLTAALEMVALVGLLLPVVPGREG